MGAGKLGWGQLQRRRTDKLADFGSWALPPCRAAAGADGTHLMTLGDVLRIWWLVGQTRVVTLVYAGCHGR